MKKNVEQQKELVTIQKNQFAEQQKLFEPLFFISNTEVFNVLGQGVDRNSANSHLLTSKQNVFVKVVFKLINFGEEIFDLRMALLHKDFITI